MNGALVNLQLKLFSGVGVQTNQNDDWGGGSALVTAFAQAGAFTLPASSRDAALLLILQPGTYTAQVAAWATQPASPRSRCTTCSNCRSEPRGDPLRRELGRERR